MEIGQLALIVHNLSSSYPIGVKPVRMMDGSNNLIQISDKNDTGWIFNDFLKISVQVNPEIGQL